MPAAKTVQKKKGFGRVLSYICNRKKCSLHAFFIHCFVVNDVYILTVNLS